MNLKYTFEEIVTDGFIYSLQMAKINLTFYFYKVYSDDILVSKEICIDRIIDIFISFNQIKANSIQYIEEILFILELMIGDI